MNELVSDLTLDFTGEDGLPILPPEVFTRMAERALAGIGADLGVTYRVEAGTVVPTIPAEHREIWLIRAKILVCRYLRAQTANSVSFTSGDKSISRGREAANWGDLEKTLLDEYRERVRRINPAADETLMKMDATPLVYTMGRRRPERE